MNALRAMTIASVVGLSVILVVGILFWVQSPSERWLLFCASDAEQYAERIFARGVPEGGTPADCLIDVYSAVNPKERTALFSPHDNHDITVIYAPARHSDQITYEQQVAHRIRQNWYALF